MHFHINFFFTKNAKNIEGHPDAWFVKYNVALFVHGCFWHRHSNCKYAYTPKSRVEFWTAKFQKNLARDRTVIQRLENRGVRVLIIWECTTKKMMKSQETELHIMNQIERFLVSNEVLLEL